MSKNKTASKLDNAIFLDIERPIDLETQKILILGYGLTGKALVKFCQNRGYDFVVFADSLPLELANIFFSKVRDINYKDIEFCIVSPGFKKSHPVIEKVISYNIPIVSEIEFASKFVQAPIIAVTGTNGKTTSVSMLRSVLSSKSTVHLVGNIGVPFISKVDSIKKDDLVILEVSSAQLEFTEKLPCLISVILNIEQDHLDRYTGIKEYTSYKKKILKNAQLSILGLDLTSLVTYSNHKFICKDQKGNEIAEVMFSKDYFSLNFEGKHSLIKFSQDSLNSSANIGAASLTLLIGVILGLNINQILERLKLFQSLEYRIEPVYKAKKVTFFNDSKSTNPAATKFAIDSLGNKNIILIVGGHDYKKMSFKKLAVFLSKRNLKKIIVLGKESKNLIKSLALYGVVYTLVYDIDTAIKIAWESSHPEDNILFSPGCNGRDMFTNHKQRGELYEEKVNQIIHEK